MNTKRHPIVVALTGASGAVYGVRLLEVLLRAGRRIHLTLSPAAVEVLQQELQRQVRLDAFALPDLLGAEAAALAALGQVEYHHFRNFQAGIASGSFLTAGMAICPCSMGTVAAIAHGLSENLIHRAADVVLKEQKRLVLAPRETPLNPIHLGHMLTLSKIGVSIMPPVPAFYNRPETLEDMVNHFVARVLDQFGIETTITERWHARPGPPDSD